MSGEIMRARMQEREWCARSLEFRASLLPAGDGKHQLLFAAADLRDMDAYRAWAAEREKAATAGAEGA